MVALVAAALVGHAGTTHAASLYMDNIRLEGAAVKAMAEAKLLDFAESQLNLMKAAFPKEKELILIYEADFLVAKGQKNKAAELLAGVKPSSPFFADIALKRGDLATDPLEKAKAYAAYFKAFSDPPKDRAAAEIWRDAIFKRYTALIAAGDAQKAASVLEMTKKLPEDMQFNPRMLVYLKSQAVLRLADKYLDQKKSIASLQGQITKAKKDLEGLLWAGADSVAALTYAELAHALVLLGQEDKAIKTVNDATKLLTQVEELFIKELGKAGGRASSPVPTALFYVGEAYMSKARKQKGNKEVAIDNLTKAIQSFYRVASEYQQAQISNRASARVTLVKEVLEKKYDKKIDIGASAEQAMILDSAKQAYMAKDFKKAGDLFLKASTANLRGPAVSESLKFSVVSLYRQERFLEAIAIGDFMYDWYRKSPDTSSALYNLGVTLYKASKEAKGQEKKDELLHYSNMMFSRFVRSAPTDSKTPKVALRCADYQYNQGIKARDKKNKIKDGGGSVADVNAAIETMRETFMEAVPLYEILTQHFGSTAEAVKAYNKLGWIYHIVDDKVRSAENFLEFVNLTEQPTDEKAQAKFFAAERYMRAEQYPQAIGHFTELLTWLGKDGPFKKPLSDQTRKYRNSAEGMVLWSYDLQRQGMNKEIEGLKELIANLEKGDTAEPEKKEEEKKKPAEGEEGEQAAEDAAQELTPEQQLADAKTRLAQLEKESAELREKALVGFTKFVEKYPKDPQTPSNLMKLGIMEMESGNEQAAVKWLSKLKNEHPESEAAKLAAFTLGKALVDAGKWDQASKAFGDAKDKFPGMAYANLNYIGSKQYADAQRTKPGLDAAVVLAANKEIERRSNDPNHEDHATIKPRRERLMFRIAEALLATEQYEEAITTFDRVVSEAKVATPEGNTKYYYEVLFGKGQAFKGLEQFDKALTQYDEALTYIPTDKEPIMYANAIMESAQVLLGKNTAEGTKKAAFRYQQLIFFGKPDDEQLRPYLEKAYFEACKALSRAGLTKQAEKLQGEYKEKFPKGEYRQKILVLPSKEF
jgi:tetratricopeptide (TPR) repeat protein